MTSDERFAVALRDLDDILTSVEAEESAWRHPVDRLRAAMYGEQAARLRAAYSRGDAAVRANLARAAERLTNDARQAFTIVLDTPAATSPTDAPAAAQTPARPSTTQVAPINSAFPQIVAGGLVAASVVSGALMISAAIRAVAGARNEVMEYAEYDEP